MKKVAVVIVNYKVKDKTLKCISSVEKSSYKDIQIIVVNNCEDNFEEEIKKFPEVIFIQSNQNTGYTGGNNAGIKRALKMGADFVFILNPDTEIERNTIDKLLEVSERTGAGIVGPKVLFDDRKTIWFAGGIFDKANVLGQHRGVDEKDNGQYDEEIETDYVTGGMMFITAGVFKKIGFFDEQYFLYYEDSDFCTRAKKAGFKLIYAPSAVVYHTNAQSTGLGSPLQDYFQTRNRMLFASKFLPFRTRFALLRESVRNLNMPTRRLAFFDFLIGNLGKGSFLK